jgi:hypothetical protein
MTAEVAILNRVAVALAADSAVTVQGRGGQKVYNTVNKLFGLSKYHPVGVMIFGSADLIGMPWEVIIKTFRKRLAKRSHARLEEYADELQKYLTGNPALFPPEAQGAAIRSFFLAFFSQLATQARNRARNKKEPPEKALEVVTRLFSIKLAEFPFLEGYSEEQLESVVASYEPLLRETWELVLADIPISDDIKALLRKVAGYCLCKAHDFFEPSGVVIAGYGEEDTFPVLCLFQVHYISDNIPRIGTRDVYRVTATETGCVYPFAQRDLVTTFMEGIDPNFDSFIQNAVRDLMMDKYPALISQALGGVPGFDNVALREKLAEVGAGVLEGFANATTRFRHEKHISPITNAVGFLPKDDLAALAESLVNLTSLKKRVTLDTETVGGPIDVVVISKGDGLVWMKRKHYFRPELNPHFFTNYFQEGADE